MLPIVTRRNGHLPVGPGPADPGWGRSQRWGMEGADPSVSIYDADFGASDSTLHRIVRDGIARLLGRVPVAEPTMTRTGLVSAQQSSLPAARFFQSYTGAGTGHDWSGGAVAVTPHALHQDANPHAIGAAELHPATTYDPFPSPGSLYPKVV